MDIRDHKLAWRWTDKKYAVLPDRILAQLKPLNFYDAKQLHQRTLKLTDQRNLSQLFAQAKTRTNDLSENEVSIWLEMQQPISTAEVFLSWDSEAALKTTWEIFINYWQEFCYPTSDDLVVLPTCDDWVLLYHHSEEFHFGKSATTSN